MRKWRRANSVALVEMPNLLFTSPVCFPSLAERSGVNKSFHGWYAILEFGWTAPPAHIPMFSLKETRTLLHLAQCLRLLEWCCQADIHKLIEFRKSLNLTTQICGMWEHKSVCYLWEERILKICFWHCVVSLCMFVSEFLSPSWALWCRFIHLWAFSFRSLVESNSESKS